MKYIVKRDNEILDEIVFNYYGVSLGYIELVLETNILLYKENIYLRKGLEIELPELEIKPQTREKLV